MCFTDYTDEQLLVLVHQQQAGAEEALVERYGRVVRMCARPYFLYGGDSEDLIQEGLLGLLSAIREYDGRQGVSFKTYAEVCIKNRMRSAVRSDSRKKNAPLNEGVPYDEVFSDGSQSLSARYYQRSPEEQVLARETEREFLSTYARSLSKFEFDTLRLYLQGLTYEEMAQALGKDVKAVDNAVQRIRRKLASISSRR